MNETESEKILDHARQSVARWLEYFKNIGATEPNPKPDWEPLHIGFRGDDD